MAGMNRGGPLSVVVHVRSITEFRQSIPAKTAPFSVSLTDKFYVQAQLKDEIAATSQTGIRRIEDSVEWSERDGALQWLLRYDEFHRMKSVAPTIKLNIFSVPATTSLGKVVPVPIGFALLDLRGLDLPASQSSAMYSREIPVHWRAGAAAGIHVTSTGATTIDKRKAHTSLMHVTVMLDRDARRAPVETVSAPIPHHLSTVQQPENTTTASSSGYLTRPSDTRLSASEHSSGTGSSGFLTLEMDAIPIGITCSHGFSLRISLQGLLLEPSIMHEVLRNTIQRISSSGQACWLSYKIFGALSQTDKFRLPDISRQTDGVVAVRGFPVIHDEFSIKSTLPEVVAFFASMPPLDIYLCTENTAIAVAALSWQSFTLPAQQFLDSHESYTVAADTFPGVQLEGAFAAQPIVDGAKSAATPALAVSAAVMLTPTGRLSDTRVVSHAPTPSEAAFARSAAAETGPEGSEPVHDAAPRHDTTSTSDVGASVTIDADEQEEVGALSLTPVLVSVAAPELTVNNTTLGESTAAVALARFLGEWKSSPSSSRFCHVHADVEYHGVFRVSEVLDVSDLDDDEEQVLQETAPAFDGVGGVRTQDNVDCFSVDARSGANNVTVHLPTAFRSASTNHISKRFQPFGTLHVQLEWRIGYMHVSSDAPPTAVELVVRGSAVVDAHVVFAASLIPRNFSELPLAMTIQDGTLLDPRTTDGGVDVSDVLERLTGHVNVVVAGAGETLPQTAKETVVPASPPTQTADVQLQTFELDQVLSAAPPTSPQNVALSHIRKCWRLTVDVRSVRNLESGVIAGKIKGQDASSATFIPLCVRYQYPELGAACGVEVVKWKSQRTAEPVPLILHPVLPRFPITVSHPSILVNKLSERYIPHGHATTSFEMAEANLFEALRAFPLGIYLQSPSPTNAHLVDDNTPAFGACLLNMGDLFDTHASVKPQHAYRCPRTKKSFSSIKKYRQHWQEHVDDTSPAPEPIHIRVLDVQLPILAASQAEVRVSTLGQLRVLVYLEELSNSSGEVQGEMPPITPEEISQYVRSLKEFEGVEGGAGGDAESNHPTAQQQPSVHGAPAAASAEGSPSLDDPAAMRAALDPLVAAIVAREEAAMAAWRAEVEREWIAAKTAAEDSWRKEAENNLSSRLQVLEAAWADREAERQTAIAAAQESCARVEAKLRKLLVSAEAKEKEIDRLREEAKTAFDAKTAELNAVARRLREDAEHAASIAKQREAAAAARVGELSSELESVRAQYTALRKEYDAAMSKLASGPDALLRDAIASLQAEKAVQNKQIAELSSSVTAETRAKEEARLQVLRLAKEVARLRDELRLRDIQEAQKLKVMFLAAEERYVLEGDRAALKTLKEQVDSLISAGYPTSESKTSSPTPVATKDTDTNRVPPFDFARTVAEVMNSGDIAVNRNENVAEEYVSGSEIQRLKSERKLLTGTAPRVYTASHPVIRDIDRRLATLQAAASAATAAEEV